MLRIATITVTFLITACPQVVRAQETPAPAGDLEKRLQAVLDLVYGDKRHPLPPAPWTDDNLNAYLKDYFATLDEAALLPPTEKGRLTYAHMKMAVAAMNARNRLALAAQKPAPPEQTSLLAWYDATTTFHHAQLHELSLGLECLRRYVAFKAEQGATLGKGVEGKYVVLLTDLEESLRLRLVALRALQLTRRLDDTPAGKSADDARQRLKALLALLPEKHRTGGDDGLVVCSRALDSRIAEATTGFFNVTYYTDFLLARQDAVFERLTKLRDGGSSTERLRLEKAYVQIGAEQMKHSQAIFQWNLEVVRLCALQNHLQHGNPSERPAPALKLPRDHAVLGQGFEKSASAAINRLRSELDVIEGILDKQKNAPFSFKEWLAVKGTDAAAGLLEGLINDATSWMDGVPATQKRLRLELLIASGVTEYKDRLKDLAPKEREKIEQFQRRSLKDVVLDFDRDTIRQIRADLDLFASLLTDYPPTGLVLVSKPWWPEEPTVRLTKVHCKDLSKPAAARAYLRLLDQLSDDYEAYSAERCRLMIGLQFKAIGHLRASAKKQ